MKAVNLLPPDLRSSVRASASGPATAAAAASGAGAYAVVGILALAVVALVGYVLAGNAVKQRRADLATATARAAAVQQQMTALKPYADFDAVAKARVNTVRSLVSDRFRWDRALRDLSRAVPADVTLTQLDGTVSSTASAAGASSADLRGALDVPAFELQGCTSGQVAVARLMSRLRMVGGVTRVSLARSDKDTVTQRSVSASDPGQAAPQAAGDAPVGACGKGDKPTFDVVAFFEHDAAAATASTNPAPSGAAGAGAKLAASAAEASSTAPTSSSTSTTASK